MKNWKTTSAGVLAIVLGGAGLYFAAKDGLSLEEISVGATAILTGVGLLLAKDKDVTGIGDNAKRESDGK